ncbi:LysR family transcriptional regulator [Pseudoalteromonas lipolytica SCSIO 04301]|uniref:LysR family transcriptional regulator n=1 Tax=Pseudoalteromonas lipolytica TaxID=570156 RepID=UPI00044E8C8E|nr:LysR family transcriptional regulator [Pseudoalteromonas lipolytica]EWH05512.1 LysR family transcriptional regulator [Pseudoalteromonas lipolytica SCSIO 04301]
MLDDLHLFIEIARRKSMSQTAKDLGLNLSTLSRRIQALEDKLGEPLLQRTARGIVLTAKGETLYDELGQQVLALNSQLKQLNDSSGAKDFYLLCPQNIIAGPLMSAINQFALANPALNLHIYPSNANSQLSQKRFDLAIRVGEQQDSSYFQKRLGAIAIKLIVKKGAPTSRLVLPYSESQLPSGLLTALKNEFEQISFCFDITIARKMIEAGYGVGILPMSEISCIKDTHNFSYVETPHSIPARPIYALWAHSRTPSANALLLIEQLQTSIAGSPSLQGEVLAL